MATIDLIVLGMLKKQPLSAYEMQKLVEYRNISKWVKISTPSIYKKVLQLEDKGLIYGRLTRDGNMPEKAVYSLTEAGEREFERLMLEISCQSIRIFLDLNAVVVNLPELSEDKRGFCLAAIEDNLQTLKDYLQENLWLKEAAPEVPQSGLAVLRQQMMLVEALEKWLAELK